jgi:hypothetical protein
MFISDCNARNCFCTDCDPLTENTTIVAIVPKGHTIQLSTSSVCSEGMVSPCP